MHQVLFEQFVGSFQSAPSELILDFDCTDDRVHGLQEGRHFHGFYYDFCFLPLYVFCGEQLLVSYLRESNIDSAKHAWAILALLVKSLRKRWPSQNYPASRQRLLSMEDAALVRACRDPLYRRVGQE